MGELVIHPIDIWYTCCLLSLTFNQPVIPPRFQAFLGLDKVVPRAFWLGVISLVALPRLARIRVAS